MDVAALVLFAGTLLLAAASPVWVSPPWPRGWWVASSIAPAARCWRAPPSRWRRSNDRQAQGHHRQLRRGLRHPRRQRRRLWAMLGAHPAGAAAGRRGRPRCRSRRMCARIRSGCSGSRTRLEREWFRLLQTVQGSAPRCALAILSTLKPADLATAIAMRDKAMVARTPGVGPKVAERIVTELKDKAPAYAERRSGGGAAPGASRKSARRSRSPMRSRRWSISATVKPQAAAAVAAAVRGGRRGGGDGAADPARIEGAGEVTLSRGRPGTDHGGQRSDQDSAIATTGRRSAPRCAPAAGQLVTGVNLDASSAAWRSAPRRVALGQVVTDFGESRHRDHRGRAPSRDRPRRTRPSRVVSPCGSCRELIWDYRPQCARHRPDDGDVAVTSIGELLPNKYRRGDGTIGAVVTEALGRGWSQPPDARTSRRPSDVRADRVRSVGGLVDRCSACRPCSRLLELS